MLRRIAVFMLAAATSTLAASQSPGADDFSQVTPSLTLSGVRGMAHTVSAEPLGYGRLSFGLIGTWYSQSYTLPEAPAAGASVTTGLLNISFGASPYIDLFAVVPMYLIIGDESYAQPFGLGSFTTGVLGSMPLPKSSPFRLGAQVGVIAGTSGEQINRYAEDGYNYHETRDGFDFLLKASQSVVAGSETLGFKLHLNEGLVLTLDPDNHSNQLLLGGGFQVPVHKTLVLGIEGNARTSLDGELSIVNDAFWLTPSVHVRLPKYAGFTLGADISLSQPREVVDTTVSEYALEPFRVFGGVIFTFDALEGRRREAAEKDRAQQLAKEEAERKAAEAQARADSLARADALAREAERARADSLAQKMRADSIALAKTKARLELEISKRSDAEKQLLSTGLLLLDAVYFESGKTTVTMNSKPYLKIIAKMLTKYPKLKIEVAGHTDSRGKLQSNMLLSQARAQAVYLYLVDVAPELSDRLVVRGYGPTKPKADNHTAEGRKNNRRVELQVLNKEALKEYNP
ncbi:MAG: OmpA family protein [Chitinivibrionales bacterium]|nr:OmpA family protein [Chitinivibrionales bacterium]